MEQSYVEVSVKKKKTWQTIAIQIAAVIVVLLLFTLVAVSRLLLILGLGGAVILFWYWPRFNEEWEYIFCDGQLDFDIIQGGERRKHKLRVEIENADVIAPMTSPRLDGYRHLEVLDYSSLYGSDDLYGMAVRVSDNGEKVVIMFEPTEKMVDLMHAKCPNLVER